MKKTVITSILLAGFSLLVNAQTYLPFEQVRKYTKTQPASKYDSSLKLLTNRLGAEIHYLYPLYQLVEWEPKFKATMGVKRYHESVSELLTFAGDYAEGLKYRLRNYDSLPAAAIDHIYDTISKLRNIQSIDAKTAILSNAAHYRAIMINESHAKPLHRAFTYSLLEGLYQEGYRYLAMEAFNNFSNKCLDSLNVFTGYYTNEPVAGELVRRALELGYKLIAYEDTLAEQHTVSQRDSVQAVHLAGIFRKDPSAKILVHAGLAHISEEKEGSYTPMGWWFKRISGIDPFTVDQAGLTEGSEFEYGRRFYEHFIKYYPVLTPSVLFQNKRPFNPLEEKGYDMSLLHPATNYRHNRPTWLAMEGERKLALIQPTKKQLFLVQAYYEKEFDLETLPYRVPADQTYTTNQVGYYPLYLRKGKYKIVLRDVSYQVLGTNDLEIL